jgi:GPH family glycoside/pentoside/hexuronide:cation symporter
LVFYLINPHNHALLGGLTIILAAGAGAKFVMYWAMLPDTVEYNAVKTGRRDAAKVFGFAGFVQKVALAVNVFLFGSLLSATGYVADVAQPENVTSAIFKIMCLIPLLGNIIAIILIWRYPINALAHGALVAALVGGKGGERSKA